MRRPCGRARENRGVGSRDVFTRLGPIEPRRRRWGSRRPCAPGGYHADAALGLDAGLGPRLQRKACRGADLSFERTRENLPDLLGVSPAAETPRGYRERQASRITRWQGQETASAEGSREAEGVWEFDIDAGKVNTIENGRRDLKIAVAWKRPAAKPATPAGWESRELPGATARVMWADISAAERFRRSWHARLRRLGLPAMARLHVLGDGASWIWKAAGRALTGCRQALDVYHASQHIAAAGKRLYGEGTAEVTAFHEHGRELLLIEGGADRDLPTHRRGTGERGHAGQAEGVGPADGLLPAARRTGRLRGSAGGGRGDR